MPRYYFDLRDGDYLAPDEEGVDFPDLVAVQNKAARALADLARDTIRMSRSFGAARGLVIEARDENGPRDAGSIPVRYRALAVRPPQLAASRHPLQNILPRYSNWLRSPPTQPFPASLD